MLKGIHLFGCEKRIITLLLVAMSGLLETLLDPINQIQLLQCKLYDAKYRSLADSKQNYSSFTYYPHSKEQFRKTTVH